MEEMLKQYRALKYSLGVAVKKRRKEKGMTRKDLCAVAGCSASTVIAVERFAGVPRFYAVFKILFVLNLEDDLIKLFEGK